MTAGEIDRATIERRREEILKAQAEEYERNKKERQILIGELSGFLHRGDGVIENLAKGKTSGEIQKDFMTLKYYLRDVPEERKHDMKIDRTGKIMLWFSISLAIVAVASILFRIRWI